MSLAGNICSAPIIQLLARSISCGDMSTVANINTIRFKEVVRSNNGRELINNIFPKSVEHLFTWQDRPNVS